MRDGALPPLVRGGTYLEAGDKVCVIFNPAAARDRARGKLHALQEKLGKAVEWRPTERPGHAEELAGEAARQGFGIVAAAGGDGTVHEVANGLLAAGLPDVSFALVPVGSANDYAYALGINGSEPFPGRRKRQVDAGLVESPDGRRRFFVNSLGLGFSGAVALESRRIGWLQGLALYGLAFLRALCFRYTCPVMTTCFDDKTRKEATLSLTLAIGPREGSFVVAPEASIDDGLFDYLHVGAISRLEILRYMPRLASGGQLPADHPRLWQGRCQAVRVEAPLPLTVHIDGEFFARPEDGVTQLDIKLLPGALRVRV
ncbi:MAG: diacylglycerol kinase family protein [Gemmataceae bacterium]